MVFIATVTDVIMVIMVRISCAKKAGNGKDNKWREIEKRGSRNGKRNEKGRTTERRGESKDKPGKQWITKRLSNQETASKNACKLSNSQDPTKGNGNRRCRGGMVWLGTIWMIGMIEFRIPGIRVPVFLSQVDLQAVAQVAEQNLEASRSTQNLWDLQGIGYSDNTMITIYYIQWFRWWWLKYCRVLIYSDYVSIVFDFYCVFLDFFPCLCLACNIFSGLLDWCKCAKPPKWGKRRNVETTRTQISCAGVAPLRTRRLVVVRGCAKGRCHQQGFGTPSTDSPWIWTKI